MTSADWMPGILARIKELGLPDLAVDELAGLEPGYTNRIRHGRKRPGLETIAKLARAVGKAPRLELETDPQAEAIMRPEWERLRRK
jgi:transcriptional regulator with XRE-family HTH domain